MECLHVYVTNNRQSELYWYALRSIFTWNNVLCAALYRQKNERKFLVRLTFSL